MSVSDLLVTSLPPWIIKAEALAAIARQQQRRIAAAVGIPDLFEDDLPQSRVAIAETVLAQARLLEELTRRGLLNPGSALPAIEGALPALPPTERRESAGQERSVERVVPQPSPPPMSRSPAATGATLAGIGDDVPLVDPACPSCVKRKAFDAARTAERVRRHRERLRAGDAAARQE